MHSSRMRTVAGGGGCLPGGVCPGGCLPKGGVHLPPVWTEFLTHAC